MTARCKGMPQAPVKSLGASDEGAAAGVLARLEERPRLARRARLREQKGTGKTWLLYPERGLLLGDTARELARRCDGQRTVAEIVRDVATLYDIAPGDLEADVLEFFAELTERRLIDWSE